MRSLFGNINIQQLASEVGGDAETDYVVERYRGLDADLRGLIPFFKQQGFNYKITPEKGPWSILELRAAEALDGADEATVDGNLTTIWELAGNELEDDLYRYPGLADDAANRAAIVAEMEYQLGLIARGETTLDSIASDYFGSALAFHIFLLKAARAQSFEVSQFVLKRTTILPKRYSKKWSISNVLKQWTTTQLQEEFEIPETIKFNLPEGAWLKRVPSVRQQRDRTFIAEDQWWHGDVIDSVLYPARTVEVSS